MRKSLFLLGICTLLLSVNQVKAALIWADEFNSISGWSYQIGPITANGELEYYTNSSANSYISNGCLVIKAQQQSMGGYNYTSARMSKGSFLYGFFESKMTLPMASGSWPAFWMLGTNIGSVGWPSCGEIDIMEHVNTGSDIHCSLHWNNGGQKDWTAIRNSSPGSSHAYQCNWNMYGFKFYIDGAQVGGWVGSATTNGMNDNGMGAFRKNQFILLNLAVGGFWPGNNVQGLPWYMWIDYVRQYTAAAKKSTGSAINDEPVFNYDGTFRCFTSELNSANLSQASSGAQADVYPNPLARNGQLNLKVNNFNSAKYVEIQISDMSGKMYVNKLETSANVSFTTDLPTGLYNVRVVNGDNVTVKKLLVR
jgi:beta-glucanase (GH16 family)